jgi:superfamily II DNA or RNA helicase
MSKPVAILSHRLYVPSEYVTEKMLRAFTRRIFINKQTCNECGNDDPAACRGCRFEPTVLRFYKEHGGGWHSFASGDLGKLYEVFNGFTIEDNRAEVPLTIDLKWGNKKLWPNQRDTVREWMEYKYGTIKSAPRSGKTVMFARIACKLKQKVLIVAKQREWLDQFIVAFRDFTNISELEAADKKTYIGWIKKWSDINSLQIAVVTYQKFIRHPEIVKKYRDAFGVVFVDECDQAAAKCFHKVVNGFSAKYRFGATGTDKRKDQLHVIANHILGPVTVKGKSKQLPCAVTYHYTGYKVGKFAQWTTYINRITKDRKRTDFILDRVKRDVALGRWVVLVTDRVAHAQLMTRLLQNDDIEAETFWGGMKNRKELFAKAKRGEIRVVVAIRKLIQRGIDVTWWDSIHIGTPTANVHNYTQEVARIRTPYEGKPMPTIHFYLDVGAVAHAVKAIAERVHSQARES